jgi:hypothetical protein
MMMSHACFSPFLEKELDKNGNFGRLIHFYLHSGHKQLPPTHGHAILTFKMLTKILNVEK